jgi:8-oxo-dGTP pyrophosphatase MutT (NUDIX family)
LSRQTATIVSRVIARVREVLQFESPYVQVFEDEVRFDDGFPGTYLRIGPPPSRGSGVVVLPIAHRLIGLVQTYRYPVDAVQWGLPRGFGEHGDAGPFQSAARELAEEVGARDAELQMLGWVTPDSGMLNTRVAVVVATLPAPLAAPTDVREVSAVRWISPEDMWQQIRSGEVEDGFTLSALALAVAHGTLAPA